MDVATQLQQAFEIIYWCNLQQSTNPLPGQLAQFCAGVHHDTIQQYFAGDYDAFREAYQQFEKVIEQYWN